MAMLAAFAHSDGNSVIDVGVNQNRKTQPNTGNHAHWWLQHCKSSIFYIFIAYRQQ
jgi:hypothetical protein